MTYAVYQQGTVSGTNPSVTLAQVASGDTWNLTLATTIPGSGSGTFTLTAGQRVIGSGTFGATVGPFTAYSDEQITLAVSGTVGSCTASITGIGYARGETVPPVSPKPASATNIVTGEVTATVSGSVDITSGTVDIGGGSIDITSGTITIGQGAVINDQFQPTNVANASVSSTSSATVTLLPAPPTGQRYVLGFAVVNLPSSSNNPTGTIQETLTGSTVLAKYSSTNTQPTNTQTQFQSFVLPSGAGLSITVDGGGYVSTFSVTIYYALVTG